MRDMAPAFLLPTVAMCLLAACAPTQWGKPGADQTMAMRDGAECRKLARAGALGHYSQPPPEPFAGAVGPSPYVGMRAGAANVWQYGNTEEGPFAMEERLTYHCMRKRGYDRVPVSPGSNVQGA